MINIYPLRIHIEDTDYSGLVFHSKYLNFMERARSEWMDQLGMGLEWQRKRQLYFVVHSATIKFIKPARVHDRVEVVSSILALRHASIVFDQYLRPEGMTDKILSRAEIKVACVDFALRPTPITHLLNESNGKFNELIHRRE